MQLSAEEADYALARAFGCQCPNAASLFDPLSAVEVRNATDHLKHYVSATAGSSANLRFISVSLWEGEKMGVLARFSGPSLAPQPPGNSNFCTLVVYNFCF